MIAEAIAPTAPAPRVVLQRNSRAFSKATGTPAPRCGGHIDRILEAAIAEFAEHGYAGARIDAIAQRADANMRDAVPLFRQQK